MLISNRNWSKKQSNWTLGNEHFHYVAIYEVLCISRKPDLQSQLTGWVLKFFFPALPLYSITYWGLYVSEGCKIFHGKYLQMVSTWWSQALKVFALALWNYIRVSFGFFYLEKLYLSDHELKATSDSRCYDARSKFPLKFSEILFKKNHKQQNTKPQKGADFTIKNLVLLFINKEIISVAEKVVWGESNLSPLKK